MPLVKTKVGPTSQELAQMVKPASLTTISVPLERYYDTADKLLLMGEVYRAGGDEEQLFIMSLRFLSLVQETIPKHPDYRLSKYQKLNKAYINKLVEILKEAEVLKESINRRAFLYEEPAPAIADTPSATEQPNDTPLPSPAADAGLKLVSSPKPLEGARASRGLPKASEKYRGKHSIFGPGGLDKKPEPRRPPPRLEARSASPVQYPGVDTSLPTIPDFTWQPPVVQPSIPIAPQIVPVPSAPPTEVRHPVEQAPTTMPEPPQAPAQTSGLEAPAGLPTVSMPDGLATQFQTLPPPSQEHATPPPPQPLPVEQGQAPPPTAPGTQARPQPAHPELSEVVPLPPPVLPTPPPPADVVPAPSAMPVVPTTPQSPAVPPSPHAEVFTPLDRNHSVPTTGTIPPPSIADAPASGLSQDEDKHHTVEEAMNPLSSLGRSKSTPKKLKHKPRVISSIPTEDAAMKDHARLKQRIKLYGLKERSVRGDGNCQFRALSDQLFGTEKKHVEVRSSVVKHLRLWKDRYTPYVPEDYEVYVMKMSQDSTWGDHVTLQAASDVYGIRICVISSYPGDSFIIEISPQKLRSPKVLWLSFHAEVHYNSVVPDF